MTALILTERVEQALELIRDVKTIADAKELVDQADALQVFARRRAAATDLHADAYVILQHANRRLGQLCRELPQAPAGRKRSSKLAERFPETEPEISNTVLPISKADALAAIGVSKMQCSRLEQLADIPDAEWDARMAQLRDVVTRRTDPKAVSSTSSASDYDGDEYGTPADVLQAGREALGGAFDLDPATNAAAQELVAAKRHFTKTDNGLTKFWRAKRVWCNPPYSRGLCADFAGKFCTEYGKQRMTSGLLLVNAATDTDWMQQLLGRFAVCWFDGRIAFLLNGKPIKGNEYSQAIFYAGRNRDRFKRAFAKFGEVHAPL